MTLVVSFCAHAYSCVFYRQFAYGGPLSDAPNPGLVINGLGVIGFPLSNRESQVIISRCQRSAVGKGTKTLLDDTIRKSWELECADFSITNPTWQTYLDSLLFSTYSVLGLTCGRQNVRAESYKLLLYEKGAFFKSHQDSEKAPGMFGTLVVSLPSEHEGGDVVLTHNGKRYVVSSSQNSTSVNGTAFGAWYSDVHHEVQEVKSGYRIVLTYNPIQDPGSLPQTVSDGDSEAKLKHALSIWENALKQQTTLLPPYIIHKLEHTYSKDALKLASLKGNDLMQVQCLDRVCKDTAFNVYLAMYEKTLLKDDECDDEVFDRQEELQYVTQLDGQETNIMPDYDRSCCLEGASDSEEDGSDYDESEHEGYTGNEGAPATYWYRDTVVLIVPPSRKPAFTLSNNTKWATVLQKLPELLAEAAVSTEAQEQLKEYCEVVVSSQPERWSDISVSADEQQRRTCMEQVVIISLEHDWLNIFRRTSNEQKTSERGIHAIGQYLAAHGLEELKPELRNMILGVKSISQKWHVLQRMSVAFQSANPSVEQLAEFRDWCAESVKEALNDDTKASRSDTTALASIARNHGIDAVSARILSLDDSDTEHLTAFVLAFSKGNEQLTEEPHREFLRKVADKVWTAFCYGKRDTDRTPAYRAPPSHNSGLTKDDLAELLALTADQGLESVHTAIQTMTDAVADTTSNYLSDHLMGFVQAILANEVPALIVDGDPNLFDAVATFIETALTAFVTHSVGPEPQKPTDWSLPDRGCSRADCRDCQTVREFMADPRRRTFEWQIVGERRKHLDGAFVRYSKPGDFDVGVDKRKTPYFWTCKKEHKTYAQDHFNWTRKRDAAQKRLRDMGGRNGERLRMYLGDKYDAFIDCRVEALPKTDTAEANDPLSEMPGSALNARNNRKRAAAELGDQQGLDSQAKRARGTVADPVELSE